MASLKVILLQLNKTLPSVLLHSGAVLVSDFRNVHECSRRIHFNRVFGVKQVSLERHFSKFGNISSQVCWNISHRRKLCRGCMKADGVIWYCVSLKNVGRGPMNALAQYHGWGTSRRSSKNATVFFSLGHAIFKQLRGKVLSPIGAILGSQNTYFWNRRKHWYCSDFGELSSFVAQMELPLWGLSFRFQIITVNPDSATVMVCPSTFSSVTTSKLTWAISEGSFLYWNSYFEYSQNLISHKHSCDHFWIPCTTLLFGYCLYNRPQRPPASFRWSSNSSFLVLSKTLCRFVVLLSP